MQITFTTHVTECGNLKLDEFIRNILELKPRENVTLTVEIKAHGCVNTTDESFFHIPPMLLEEAGIDKDSELMLYTEDGKVIVSAWEDDDE